MQLLPVNSTNGSIPCDLFGLIGFGINEPQVALVDKRQPGGIAFVKGFAPDDGLRFKAWGAFGGEDTMTIGAVPIHQHEAVTAGFALFGEDCL